MAERVDTPFDAWEFDEREELQACIFSPLQIMYLKTELAAVATKQILLSPDFNKPLANEEFKTEHAYNKGQMDAIQALINRHDVKQAELRRLTEEELTKQRANRPTTQNNDLKEGA
jgi:hypothetical protein